MAAGKAIRTLIVDDEKLARERLRGLLSALPDLEIVGEAEDGDQALEKTAELQPELVFLDIQMPGRSGIEVAASLPPPRPKLVFCTAFDQYALKAFEQSAVDYLLKPVSQKRLRETVGRVMELLRGNAGLNDELERARDTQARLFPQLLPKMERLRYAGFCLPARAVGGDYYDFLPIVPDRLAIALADVSGKGLSAALLMAGLQGRLQSRVRLVKESAASLMEAVNEEIFATTDPGRFVTIFYGIFDDSSRLLTYVNAGHNPPLLFRDRQSPIHRLEPGGTVVGAFSGMKYQESTVPLEGEATLVLFTDGVTEALNSRQEEYGESRLISLVAAHLELGPEELCDRIKESVLEHVGRVPLHDDLTLVAVKGVA